MHGVDNIKINGVWWFSEYLWQWFITLNYKGHWDTFNVHIVFGVHYAPFCDDWHDFFVLFSLLVDVAIFNKHANR